MNASLVLETHENLIAWKGSDLSGVNGVGKMNPGLVVISIADFRL
jgi:hypothetical protein